MAVQVEERRSVWDTPLTTLFTVDWEKVLLVALLVLAIATRFWDLGARSYNHDESIHTSWSHDLYVGKGYIHNPIYHGPLLYHLTAATFFLFGDTDVTGRVPNVLFGIILISLPFFFRKWLGRRGWIITSLLLLISPVVTYYSRFNRHDIYVEVFVVLMLLAIMKYFETRTLVDDSVDPEHQRSSRWLYAAAAILGFSYTAMETTFIFTALFAYFLTAVFTYDWLNQRQPEGKKVYHGVIAALVGIPFFAGYVGYLVLWTILHRFGITRVPETTGRAISTFDLSIVLGTLSLPLFLAPMFINTVLKRDPLDYSSVDGIRLSAAVLIGFILFSALIGAIWNWRKWLICALLFYPIMIFFFTTVLTNPAGLGSGLIGSLGYWITQQPVQRGTQPTYYYLMVTLPLYEYLPYLFGVLGLFYILWKREVPRLFYFLSVLVPLLGMLAYIWFTPGAIGSLINLVLKGKDALQASNYTALLLGLLVPLYFLLTYDPANPRSRFPTLIGIWVLGVLTLFSWAGEKMPWLTMHLTIPLAFAAGYFMQRVLRANWRAIFNEGGLLFALVLALGILVLAFQIFFGPAPLSGTPLDQLAQRSSLILSLFVVAVCAGALVYLGQKLGLKDALRVALVTLFAIMALFTIHSTALAAYQNSDVAVETIIYAQGTPDVPNAMREIEELSRRLCAQAGSDNKVKVNCDNNTIKVAYDDESSWPFVWYLRNYRNAQFYGKSPNAPFDAEVVIAGPTNEAGVKPYLGSKYVRRNMRLIWWPNEFYKDLTWCKLFGGKDANGNDCAGVLLPNNLRSLVRDIWFYHKYPESLSAWPYVHTFAFYVRKDVASSLWQYAGVVAPPPTSAQQEDLYTKLYKQGLQAQSAFGSQGAGEGQFNNPHNLTFDPQGNLLVADTLNSRIEKFDANGKFLMQWGGKGNAPGQFNEPWSLATDKQGNVYVADTWNHRIQKFDATGKFITQWGKFGDVGGDTTANPLNVYGPRAIAVDAEGNVWLTDTGNKRVLKFDGNGAPLAQFGGAGAEPGQFLEPVGLAMDPKGNIFVADTWNQRIQKFDKDFNPIQQWSVEAWDSQSVVNKPFLATDKDGNVYASDPEGYRLLEFSNDGKLLAVWGTRGAGLDAFELPTGLMVAPDGRVYVADSGNNRISIFAPVK